MFNATRRPQKAPWAGSVITAEMGHHLIHPHDDVRCDARAKPLLKLRRERRAAYSSSPPHSSYIPPATVAHCLLTIKCSIFSQSQCLTAVVGCVLVVRGKYQPPTTSPGGQADVL